MISNAADYRYCNVSNINVRGNTMPQRGRGVSPRVLSAEDVASLAEGFYERLHLLDDNVTIYYDKDGNPGSVNCHGNSPPRHALHDPACLASSIARLCRASGVQSSVGMLRSFRAFVTPDRVPMISVRKYPSRSQPDDLGAVCSPRYGWCHPILYELGLNQCLQPFGSLNPPDWPRIRFDRSVRGHARLDVDVVRNAYDDLKQLRRLFLPMTTRYSKDDRLLLYGAVPADGTRYASANDPGEGERHDYYVSPVPELQPLVLGANVPAPARFSFESTGCYCTEPNPRGDTCDALYVSRRSARLQVSAGSSGGGSEFITVCCNDRFTLRAVRPVPLRSVGAVDSYSPANGEVVRVYALVRAWYRDTKESERELIDLVSPQEFLVSAGTTMPELPLSLVGENACRRYLEMAGMPTSVDEYPLVSSDEETEHSVHGRACGVTLVGVWALAEPKSPNLKVDVHNCAW